MPAQADSLARPLRRRFAKMARPARVRMRRRKPCLRARRRLFGWYVRLLTSGSSRRGWSHLRRSPPTRNRALYGAGAKVGGRSFDGHRSFTDLRPVNTRRVSRRPTSPRYGRTGDRSNRRAYAATHRVSSRHAAADFILCSERLLWSGDAASVRAVFGLFHSSSRGRIRRFQGDRSGPRAVHTLWITMWIRSVTDARGTHDGAGSQ
jgi:hypothetical protein